VAKIYRLRSGEIVDKSVLAIARRERLKSMPGNITLMEKEPYLHLHANLGRKDMGVVGGHLVSGEVHPFLEVVITPTSNVATRKHDEELNLNAI